MKKTFFAMTIFLLVTLSKTSAQCDAGFNYVITSYSPPVIDFFDTSFVSGQPVTYSWSFGDNSPIGLTGNITHTFPQNMYYNVCLHITDGTGCSDSLCVLVNATSSIPEVVALLTTDSTSRFHCMFPATELFQWNAIATGYPYTDSVLCQINYGDGIIATNYVGASMSIGTFLLDYQNPGTYTAQFIVTGPDGHSDTMNALPIVVSSTCGTISGTAYVDNNSNCINDAGDILVPNTGVLLFNAGQYLQWVNTDSNGYYSFNVPPGSGYEIQFQGNNSYLNSLTPVCPGSGIISNVSSPSSSNDFGLTCPPGYDLQGNITTWNLRPGFIGEICFTVYNQHCNTPQGNIIITFDPLLTPLPDSSGAGLYSVSGNTVTYPINSPDLYWLFCIPVSVSQSAFVGDTVCISATVQPETGDDNPSNNTFTLCSALINSHDPNDKSVSPDGSVTTNTPLTYTIRFQNTGTADAINVFILDTLSPNLNPATIEVVASSHVMTYSMLTGNILRFNFDNIHLADSNTNEQGSHGFVSYRIHQADNLLPLTSINNTAAIYFDFNQPVLTNTTTNIVDQSLTIVKANDHSSVINIYPNPSNGQCHLFFRNNHSRTISVADVLGRQVSIASSTSDSFILNTEKYVEGTYTIRIQDGDQTNSYKFIVAH